MSIKLIAADMDGTLLDSAKQLPEGLFPLIRALRRRGIRFAPASGRQYYTLYRQFGEIADELLYISENGAMVCDGAEIVSFEAMPAEEVCRAVELVRTLPGVYTVVSARDGGVYEDGDDPAFLKNMSMYCARHKGVPDLLEFVRHEPVCKVALSGADWVDLMRPGMSKGLAIGALCGRLQITPAECMAFGDYLNDLELLQAVGEPYAMANAHDALKKAAKHICPSNDEDGVCRTIRAVFGIDKP